MDKKLFSRPIRLNEIKVTDDFWKKKQELVRTEVIPYQWEALNDRIEEADPSFCIRNFKIAAKLLEERNAGKAVVSSLDSEEEEEKESEFDYRGFNVLPDDPENMEDTFYGFVFQDSDVYKWIEAVGYSLINHPDPELEALADSAIEIIAAAQQDNGYLDTYYIINGPDFKFTNLRDHHELYCMGHLIEGAIAYYEATGKDRILQVACRYADYVDSYFAEDKCQGYPGHEIAEMALARLYEVTGEKRYQKLMDRFLNRRGTSPFYFDCEENTAELVKKGDPNRYAYYQAHKPVKKQDEAVGHAVRAVYLYAGMADAARLDEDQEMEDACRRLWDSIVRTKLYVTGGIGGTVAGESFSTPYDLPNEAAYSETCAAIGLAFFARRMLQLEADSRYSDVMEQALYNTVLAGMALDGKSFFYVNPLEVMPEHAKKDERLEHVKTVRQKWFGCACCPPNISRIVSSIPAYAYTLGRDTLFAHLFIGGELEVPMGGKQLKLKVNSELPWEGKVSILVTGEEAVSGTIAFRIPGWTRRKDMKILLKEQGRDCALDLLNLSGDNTEIQVKEEKGYFYITKDWSRQDQLDLEFSLPVRILRAHRLVLQDYAKAAVTRGPITYCAEEIDNGKNLHLNILNRSKLHQDSDVIKIEGNLVTDEKVISLKVPATRYTDINTDDSLYFEDSLDIVTEEECQVTMIPYYAWNNRGEGEMRVWLPFRDR